MGTNNLQDNTYLGIVVFSSLFLLFVDVVAAYYVVCMRLLVWLVGLCLTAQEFYMVCSVLVWNKPNTSLSTRTIRSPCVKLISMSDLYGALKL